VSTARGIFGRLDLLHRGFRPKPAKLTPKNIFITRHFSTTVGDAHKAVQGRLQVAARVPRPVKIKKIETFFSNQ
jgi:hypothetical protein